MCFRSHLMCIYIITLIFDSRPLKPKRLFPLCPFPENIFLSRLHHSVTASHFWQSLWEKVLKTRDLIITNRVQATDAEQPRRWGKMLSEVVAALLHLK